MPATLSTRKIIHGQCERCKHVWRWEGWEDDKAYKAIVSGKKSKLCTRCIDAQQHGEYRYTCDGCGLEVRGQFEDLRDLIFVEGRSFCFDCKVAFYGKYDLNNPALKELLANRASKQKRRTFMGLASDEQQALFKQALAYSEVVRGVSRANLRRSPELLNPRGYKLGRSGLRGAYQLDHIIPVLVCWEYGVSQANEISR
jgi:hypothetical protein